MLKQKLSVSDVNNLKSAAHRLNDYVGLKLNQFVPHTGGGSKE